MISFILLGSQLHSKRPYFAGVVIILPYSQPTMFCLHSDLHGAVHAITPCIKEDFFVRKVEIDAIRVT